MFLFSIAEDNIKLAVKIFLLRETGESRQEAF